MAIVTNVVDGDGASLAVKWMELLDSNEEHWRYAKGQLALPGATVHLHFHRNGKLEILVGADGKPLLRQDGHGLPPKMVVRFAEGFGQPAGPGPMAMSGLPGGAVWAEAGEVFEYNQEQAGQGSAIRG